MRVLFAVLRVAVAAAVIAAIVAQLVTSYGFWTARGVESIWINVVNFFSFFTIDSNIGAAAVGLIGAVVLLGRTGRDPVWFNGFRVAVVTPTWSSPGSFTTCCCAASSCRRARPCRGRTRSCT